MSLETATWFVDTIETLVDLVDDHAEIPTETRDPNGNYLFALAKTNAGWSVRPGPRSAGGCGASRSLHIDDVSEMYQTV